MNETLGNSATGLHRRTVLKGAAWSVPVVAAAVAVPAYAASGCADYSVGGTGFVVSGSNYTATYGVAKTAGAQPLSGWSLVITLVPKAGAPSITVPATTTSGTPIARTTDGSGNTVLTINGAPGTSLSFSGSFTGGYTGSAVWTKGSCAINRGIDFGANLPPFTGMNATLNAGSVGSGNPGYLAGTATFTPPAGVAPVTHATLTFTVDQKKNQHVLNASGTVVSGPGWSFTSASANQDSITYVFTYSGSVPAGATSTLSFRLNATGAIGTNSRPIKIAAVRSLSGTQFATVSPSVTTTDWN
ncbi:hypothetical protein ACTJI8_14055 [Microbacterium sp. 22303]|uniref:hypothetical protein n=1 Tax=Microbacterium sp. 22303 TaxID=3453905 RepID=UPI003F82669B